jgi:hypothetical protein
MKTVIIENEKFNVEDQVHDLLCLYSNIVQMACLVRQAQKEYFRKKDIFALRKSKELEFKLDEMLNGKQTTNQMDLFK